MKTRGALRPAVSAASLWLLSCGQPTLPVVNASESRAASSAQAVEYSITVDDALTRLDVSVCFVGAMPSALHAGQAGAGRYVTSARLRRIGGDGASVELNVTGDRIHLRGAARDSCVDYVVNVAAMVASGTPRVAARWGDTVIANVSLWLWRVARDERGQGASTVARVHVPPGMVWATPWTPTSSEAVDSYRLDNSVFDLMGFGAFGRLETQRFKSAGTSVVMTIAPGFSPATRAALVPWLQQTISDVAGVKAAALAAELHVFVAPATEARETVGLGHIARGGGAGVVFVVDPQATLEQLRGDWVAVHELSHLLLPFVQRPDAWLSEGMATYYQEIVRVRAGNRDAVDAWARIWRGVERASSAVESLVAQSESMYRTYNFSSVYWGGAEYALRVDVELRARHHSSLDAALAAFAKHGDHARSVWTADALLAELDRLTESDVFFRTAAGFAHVSPTPGLAGVYAELGIEVNGTRAKGLAAAPLAQVRDAIMSRNALAAAAANP